MKVVDGRISYSTTSCANIFTKCRPSSALRYSPPASSKNRTSLSGAIVNVASFPAQTRPV